MIIITAYFVAAPGIYKSRDQVSNDYHNAGSSPVQFITAPGIYKSRDPRWLGGSSWYLYCKPCTLTRTGTCSRYHGKQARHL